jgi:YfiH family protein
VRWRQADDVRWLEACLPGARAAFSTRLGGVSEGPFASLNLGLLTGDEPAAVLVNRRRLAEALGRDPVGVLIGHQMHAATVSSRGAAVDPNPFTEPLAAPAAPADGQATTNPALTPLVQVADCLPIALAGPRGVAMLHCGWRGLARGIVERGVEATAAVAAAIGPGIGRCCYEVGDEVLDAFGWLGEGIAAGRMLDLPEVARRLLDRAGVGEVDSAVACTRCEPELFFSHRRDGSRTGRQAGLAWSEAGG